jgi:hypothetical protein
VSEVWVVNASPLIALAKVGRLDVLTDAGRGDEYCGPPSTALHPVLGRMKVDLASHASSSHPGGKLSALPMHVSSSWK